MWLLLCLAQAWRCAAARAQLQQLRLEAAQLAAQLPQLRARAAWLQLFAAAKQALAQQRLQLAQQEAATLVLQATCRGWQARRQAARQLAGITRFQVRGQ